MISLVGKTLAEAKAEALKNGFNVEVKENFRHIDIGTTTLIVTNAVQKGKTLVLSVGEFFLGVK